MFKSSERTSTNEIKNRLIKAGVVLALASVGLTACAKAGAEPKTHESAAPKVTSSAQATSKPTPTETTPATTLGEGPLTADALESIPSTADAQTVGQTLMKNEITYLNSDTNVNFLDQANKQAKLGDNVTQLFENIKTDAKQADDAEYNKDTIYDSSENSDWAINRTYYKTLDSIHSDVVDLGYLSNQTDTSSDGNFFKVTKPFAVSADINSITDESNVSNKLFGNAVTGALGKPMEIEIDYTEHYNYPTGVESQGQLWTPSDWKEGRHVVEDFVVTEQNGQWKLTDEQIVSSN